MRIIRRETYRRMPWKNGQGLTEEVAAFPEGAGVDDFDWRLSIAHVGADGPFSLFAGIDRTIALLDGPGLVLDLPEGPAATLSPGGEPFSFPGEWRISSRNAGGPTIDLNIMTRRGRCAHQMRRLPLDGERHVRAEAVTLLVLDGEARLGAEGGGEQALHRFDTVMLDAGEAVSLAAARPCDVWMASLFFPSPTDAAKR